MGQIRDEWKGRWYRTKIEHSDRKALTRYLRDVCAGMEKGFALPLTMEEVK